MYRMERSVEERTSRCGRREQDVTLEKSVWKRRAQK